MAILTYEQDSHLLAALGVVILASGQGSSSGQLLALNIQPDGSCSELFIIYHS